ncbi:acylneuraminate cytidylyltransferase family protein [Capnocytophaga stomatis]|uniref:acylneuraminate cytidylyltransferase family protein n=1 Tax=Capnocytophaga stomatis TaxID=1848904 RepID=UPI00385A2648
MNLLITICARGGSKGIPGKNIKLIGEVPLIYYTLKTANKFKEKQSFNVDIVLSTDDKLIKEVVRQQGFYIETDYERPAHLASDTAGKLDTIADVKSFMENKHQKQYDFLLDLDVTSPLRTVEDLEEALKLLQNDECAYNIFSVNPCNRNPYFNMVEANAEGYYNLCKQGTFLTRQSAPKVYDMNASFYIYRNSFFKKGFSTAITDKTLIFEMNHVCFDLDHPIDFEFMEYLITNKKLSFDL